MKKMPSIISNQPLTEKGFILLLTLIFMTVLTLFVGALMYMATYETKAVGSQTDDLKLRALADAGVECARLVLNNDYLGLASPPGSAIGTADLRGGNTSFCVSVGNAQRMCYIGESSGLATINNNNDSAIITGFDSNYTNTRIISIEAHVRASRASGGTGATMQFSYTTDGVNYNTLLTPSLTTQLTDYFEALPPTATWPTIMDTNSRLRVLRIAGNRNVSIDAIYLRVTYGIDTLKERWAAGGYASFPISLGGGTIESITITDEQSKVHLNYASQALLQNLLTNLGITSASTKAAAIVNYRGASLTNPFDSVEELQRVAGITAPDYNIIKDYVTVYSFVSTNAYRPTGARAPVNINTASFQVLKAVFDSLALGSGDATTLANGIISFRNNTPFKGFYTSTSTTDNTYFYNYVRNASYLSTSGNPDEKDRAMDNADPSSLIPYPGSAGYNCVTTEFCYASSAFHIEALAKVGKRELRVKTLVGNDGSRTFSNYIDDPTPSGWYKETFE